MDLTGKIPILFSEKLDRDYPFGRLMVKGFVW